MAGWQQQQRGSRCEPSACRRRAHPTHILPLHQPASSRADRHSLIGIIVRHTTPIKHNSRRYTCVMMLPYNWRRKTKCKPYSYALWMVQGTHVCSSCHGPEAAVKPKEAVCARSVHTSAHAHCSIYTPSPAHTHDTHAIGTRETICQPTGRQPAIAGGSWGQGDKGVCACIKQSHTLLQHWAQAQAGACTPDTIFKKSSCSSTTCPPQGIPDRCLLPPTTTAVEAKTTNRPAAATAAETGLLLGMIAGGEVTRKANACIRTITCQQAEP